MVSTPRPPHRAGRGASTGRLQRFQCSSVPHSPRGLRGDQEMTQRGLLRLGEGRKSVTVTLDKCRLIIRGHYTSRRSEGLEGAGLASPGPE